MSLPLSSSPVQILLLSQADNLARGLRRGWILESSGDARQHHLRLSTILPPPADLIRRQLLEVNQEGHRVKDLWVQSHHEQESQRWSGAIQHQDQ